jgi:hypothetical protein
MKYIYYQEPHKPIPRYKASVFEYLNLLLSRKEKGVRLMDITIVAAGTS